MKKQNKTVNKKMKFSELIDRYPEISLMLVKKGMHCLACPVSNEETIEEGALAHGVNPDSLIKEIKNEIENIEKKP